MGNEELCEVVEKFYSISDIVNMSLNDHMKRTKNKNKIKDIVYLRINRKYGFMSGKEQLDNVLKKAYLYDFEKKEKEEKKKNKSESQMKELNDVLEIINLKINELMKEETIDEDAVNKKKQEKEILEKKLEETKDLKPDTKHINYNNCAFKILKILEKDDYTARKLHLEIKSKICKTTDSDDFRMKKEMEKYLSPVEREERNKYEKQRNEKYEKNRKPRSSGYVPPHLRQTSNNNNVFTKTADVSVTEENFPSLSNNSTNVKNIGVWGTKNISKILEENNEDNDENNEVSQIEIENTNIDTNDIKSDTNSNRSRTSSVHEQIKEKSVSDDWLADDWSSSI